MSKNAHTSENNNDTLDLSGCLTTAESEVDLSTETDFLADEENFEVSDILEADEDEDFNADFNHNLEDETGFDDMDSYVDINDTLEFPEFDQIPTHRPLCSHIYETITALANFGQTCTTDKQRDTVLDLMWLCVMNKYN